MLYLFDSFIGLNCSFYCSISKVLRLLEKRMTVKCRFTLPRNND